MPKKKINKILITGTPRSGTTLISQIVNNHKNISCIYDSLNYMRFAYKRYGEDRPDTIVGVFHLIDDLEKRINKRWNMTFKKEKLKRKVNTRGTWDYFYLYDEIMKMLVLKPNSTKIWAEKTTNVVSLIPDFLKGFKNGGVIHIIRNPYSVLNSWKKFTHAKGYDYLGMIFNLMYSYDFFISNALNYGNRYFPIKYEQLIQAPAKVCLLLQEEFKLNPDIDGMMDSSKFKDKQGQKWVGNSMFKEINGITYHGEDREMLDEFDYYIINKYLGYQMKLLAYKEEHFSKECLISGEFLSFTDKEQDVFNSSEYLQRCKKHYLETNKGIEEFPLNPLDADNWESEKEQLAKKEVRE